LTVLSERPVQEGLLGTDDDTPAPRDLLFLLKTALFCSFRDSSGRSRDGTGREAPPGRNFSFLLKTALFVTFCSKRLFSLKTGGGREEASRRQGRGRRPRGLTGTLFSALFGLFSGGFWETFSPLFSRLSRVRGWGGVSRRLLEKTREWSFFSCAAAGKEAGLRDLSWPRYAVKRGEEEEEGGALRASLCS